MNGWSYGGTVKANKHWQSGKKHFTFDLLKPSSFPYMKEYSNGSTVNNSNKSVQVVLGSGIYGYLFYSGVGSLGGLGVYSYSKKGIEETYAESNSLNTAYYHYINNPGFIKKVDTVPGVNMQLTIKILSVPEEWKDADIYLTNMSGQHNIAYNTKTAGGSDYLRDGRVIESNTTDNVTGLATKDFPWGDTSNITGYKVGKGVTFTRRYVLNTATNNYWSDRLGLGFVLNNLAFIADGHETAEESLTDTFKVQFEYTEYEAS